MNTAGRSPRATASDTPSSDTSRLMPAVAPDPAKITAQPSAWVRRAISSRAVRRIRVMSRPQWDASEWLLAYQGSTCSATNSSTWRSGRPDAT